MISVTFDRRYVGASSAAKPTMISPVVENLTNDVTLTHVAILVGLHGHTRSREVLRRDFCHLWSTVGVDAIILGLLGLWELELEFAILPGARLGTNPRARWYLEQFG